MPHLQLTINRLSAAELFSKVANKTAASLILLAGVHTQALAVEVQHSFFGTLQYTQSTDEFAYSRFIDDEGTFRYNSLLGYQLDARLSPNLAGTIQIIGTNKLDADSGQEVRLRQGFLAYEDGGWTFRAGRQRVPLYLDSRNFDVKHTYTVANLPPEVYLTSAADSYDGLSITRNISSWLPESHSGDYAQVSLYVGPLDYKLRSANFGSPVEFFPVSANVAGAALSASGDDWAASLSYTQLKGEISGSTFLGPLGLRPFDLDFDIEFISAGLRKSISEKLTLTGEYVHITNEALTQIILPFGMSLNQAETSRVDSASIIAEYLLKQDLTGYLGFYTQKSDSVNQNSVAAGVRLDLDFNRSVKAEILAVNAKQPTGAFEGPGPRAFNIFSLSYNWAY